MVEPSIAEEITQWLSALAGLGGYSGSIPSTHVVVFITSYGSPKGSQALFKPLWPPYMYAHCTCIHPDKHSYT